MTGGRISVIVESDREVFDREGVDLVVDTNLRIIRIASKQSKQEIARCAMVGTRMLMRGLPIMPLIGPVD